MSSAQFDDKTTVPQGGPVAGAQGNLVAGTDGDVVLPLRTDASGILQVNLAVPTVSVTGINASVGTTAATPPVFTTQVGGTDGTVLRELHFTPPSAQAPATDPALIVTFSPNSPLPSGTNTIGKVTTDIGLTGGLALDATLTGGSQQSRLTNGTDQVAVATGAAGTGDNALVVGLSPNSPLPAGSNALGSVTATQSTAANLLAQVSQPTASSLNATAVQGTAAALTGAWPVKNTDGTNVAAVKAASTAVAATDPALAVSLSPNSPLPAGSNAIGTVTAVQATAASLNATVVQGTAANLNATVVLTGTAIDTPNGLVQVQSKPVIGSAYSWTRYQNLGASVAAVIKATAGMLFSLNVHNNNAATRYVQLFNSTTTPSPGAVPLFSFLVPASGLLLMDSLFFGQDGFYFSSGIVIACSTTETTYTAGSASDLVTHAMYL